MYQLIIETPEGVFYVMPPTDQDDALGQAAIRLSQAYPLFTFTTPRVPEEGDLRPGQTRDSTIRKKKPIPPL